MIDFIKNTFSQKKLIGVILDTRTQTQKDNDYAHEERIFSKVIGVFNNPIIKKSLYEYENQNSTSSCTYHGIGLGLQIFIKSITGRYFILSKMFGYRQRYGYPDEGAIPTMVFNDFKTIGACLYSTLPTPKTEEEANSVVITSKMINEAEIFDEYQYYVLKNSYNDIETLANISQKGLAIPICIFATVKEWSTDYVKVIDKKLTLDKALVRHEVCILPYSSFTKNGIRYITIQDSSWFGGKKLRYLNEDFIKSRVYHAAYWDKKPEKTTVDKPVYKFTKILRVGSRGIEVKNVQQLLASLGFLDSDCLTGYFGGKTLAAVRAFQVAYVDDILTPLGLAEPTDIWGAQCIKKANTL